MDKLISQQAAINTIKKRLFETAFNNVGIKQNIDETLSDVAENRLEIWFNELPSIHSEHKTGRWIPDNTDYYRTKFICSACGESEEVPTTGFGYGTMWDYCPMCGAKMEGGAE